MQQFIFYSFRKQATNTYSSSLSSSTYLRLEIQQHAEHFDHQAPSMTTTSYYHLLSGLINPSQFANVLTKQPGTGARFHRSERGPSLGPPILASLSTSYWCCGWPHARLSLHACSSSSGIRSTLSSYHYCHNGDCDCCRHVSPSPREE